MKILDYIKFKIMKTINSVIFIFFAALSIQAQTIYRTQEGHIMIIANNEYEPIKVESNQLSVYLDYTRTGRCH